MRTAFVPILSILAIASFFRLWQLDKIPPGIWPDEAQNATDALEALETGNYQLFYQANHGREGFFINLIALSFGLFGVSIWSFKIVPAIIGILTVFGQFLLTKELFRILHMKYQMLNPQSIALLSSFFLAISFWHTNFSRIDFRAILVPFVLVFAFYFFFHGIRTKKFFDFIAGGMMFGLGFHTYIGFRLAVILLGFALFWWFLVSIKEKWYSAYLVSCSLLLVAIFLAALPMGLYFISHPQDFVSRALGVSVFEEEHPISAFGKSFGAHLLMFNVRGDPNWRHNFGGMPQLGVLVDIFFLVGVLYALKNLKNPLSVSGIYLFLFVWLFALLLPGALTVEGIPHALRTIGVIPASYIFAGLGAYRFFQWGKEKWLQKKWSPPVLQGLVVLFFVILTAA